ncbi:MAG: NUDIX domain-containing protein [Oscillospiraceae bacterium]|nr:NUDIX domain-containing protein [Oscillospiraceae bacterium]
MTLYEAIFTRSSCREFLPHPLSPAQRQQLGKAVEQCNHRSGLRFRLFCGQPEPFVSSFKGWGQIRGAQNYLLLAGDAEDALLEEKCGYYGEELILTAHAMGLGTCWVGGTYDREYCLSHLSEGEELVCVAAVGDPVPAKEKDRACKSIDTLAPDCEDAPAWFRSGIEAVQRAPSAMNRQGYCFTCRRDGSVRIRLHGTGSFALVDLGIAKRHFELGAHGGEWSWGDGGIFRKAREEKSCGAVVWRQGAEAREYLLVRHNGGHWSFPKGHVENRETEAETAAREIWEETGLTAEIHTDFRQQVTYSPKPGTVKDVIFFTAVPTGGKERPQESEISQLGWFSFSEAAQKITYASDEEILLAAEAYLGRD